MLNISEIKARVERASEGPWLIQRARDKSAPQGVIDTYSEEAEGYFTVATVHEPGAANEDFIAHARTDIPALVQALEEAQAEIRQIVKERGEWAKAAGVYEAKWIEAQGEPCCHHHPDNGSDLGVVPKGESE